MRNPQPHSTASGQTEGRAPEASRRPPLTSDELLRGSRLVEITHNGEIYRLQSTRLGKLILTK